MILLGLTGSIGMGKSTTAQMLRQHDLPVWDADATVHALYAENGAAVGGIAAMFPSAIRAGAVDRAKLKDIIANDPKALSKIEQVVHPLVAMDREGFIARNKDADIIVLDIPLLFEAGADQIVDKIAVVSTDGATQRTRVLARDGMTEETLDLILARQTPDAEKRAKADYIIRSATLETAQADIAAMLDDLRGSNDA